MSRKLLRRMTRKRKRLKVKNPFADCDPQTLLMTMTEEFYQPARIHYTVHDKSRLQELFMDLKCVDYDAENDRWVVHFEDEAANTMKLKKSVEEIAPEARPMVIASLFSPEKSRMYVDVNSFERLLEIIKFLNRFVDRRVAVATHFQLYNLFSTVRDGQPFHDILFGTGPVPRPQEHSALEAFTERVEQGEDREAVLHEAMEHIERKNQNPLERIETLPLFFDDDQVSFEDEMTRLTMIVRGRVIIAGEHYRGNTDFTWYDLMNRKSDPGMFPS
jgi:hypothetical protein